MAKTLEYLLTEKVITYDAEGNPVPQYPKCKIAAVWPAGSECPVIVLEREGVEHTFRISGNSLIPIKGEV